MKSFIRIIAFLILPTIICYSQFEKRSVELSMTGVFGAQKSLGEYKSYVFLSTTIDYFILKNLSIQPQIDILASRYGPPSKSMIANVSYSHRISNSNIALFIRGGYGRGNSIIFPALNEMVPIQVVKNWEVKILNAGTGAKIIISEAFALKIEANFRQETYPRNYYNYFYPSYGSYTANITYSNIALLFGFSVFL